MVSEKCFGGGVGVAGAFVCMSVTAAGIGDGVSLIKREARAFVYKKQKQKIMNKKERTRMLVASPYELFV